MGIYNVTQGIKPLSNNVKAVFLFFASKLLLNITFVIICKELISNLTKHIYLFEKVYITYKLSFTDRACDSVSISDRTLVNVGGSLVCFGGCSGTLMSSLSYQCTDYSVDENWKYGQRTVILTFPSAQNDSYAFG